MRNYGVTSHYAYYGLYFTSEFANKGILYLSIFQKCFLFIIFCVLIECARIPVSEESESGHKLMEVKGMKADRTMTALTPETYPLPGDHGRCGSNYLKLDYVCDPDSFLSHTEALIINNTLGRKFFHCFPSDQLPSLFQSDEHRKPDRTDLTNEYAPGDEGALPQSRNEFLHYRRRNVQTKYTIGIALAKTMQDGVLEECNGIEKRYDLNEEKALQSLLEKAGVLRRLARKLRVINWTNKLGRGCITDILILIVQNVVTCVDGSKAIFSGGEPLMGLSFSNRVRKMLSEVSAAKLEQSRRRWKTSETVSYPKSPRNCQNSNCVINLIKRIMQVLEDGLPDYIPEDNGKSSTEDTAMTSDPDSSMVWFSRPQHKVPLWALIAFGISGAVTLMCACLGHWVSTGRSRLHRASEATTAGKNQRRWRAGFGGGMLEMHTVQQQKGGAMTSGSGFGGGSQTRSTKAKMFGGISMAPSRSKMGNGGRHIHRV